MTLKTRIPNTSGVKKEDEIIVEAVSLSADWYQAYIEKHTYEFKRFTLDVTVKLAIARYEWLLSTATTSIFDNFSDDELYNVAISLQRELAIPNDYPLARAIADDNLILWENYKQSQHSALIDKLLALTPLEDMALRDMVERFWHGLPVQEERFSVYIQRLRNHK